MKKLLIILSIIGLCIGCGKANAEPIKLGEIIDKLQLSQGVAYNIVDSKFEYITSTPIIEKGDFTLEIGYASNESLITVASYKLLSLKDYIDTPLVKHLMAKPGLFYGLDRISKGEGEAVWGVSFTALEIKF